MTEQLTLDLGLPACTCFYFKDYHSGQRSVEFKADCPHHRIYIDNVDFQIKMFYGTE